MLVALLIFAAPAFAQEGSVPLDAQTLEQARRQFESGKTPEAIAALDALDAKSGPSGRSLDLRGRILYEKGQLDAAEKLFSEALEKDKASLARLHLGDVFLARKKFPQARDTYRAGTKETNILGVYERLRFGMLLSYLGEKNDADAQEALGQIRFPSETGAYYFAQAAWAYGHGQTRDAEKWIKRCEEIFGGKVSPWFAGRFYDMGWTKTKAAASAD
ncbi:MAG: tetratricopeptide repeat protein [Verrucomicrobiota bacterium]|nr:tetratricopeptide repeat protein [Verrucomicrobiota bacterium]